MNRTKSAYRWATKNGSIVVYDIGINLYNTLKSGQAFRWRTGDEGFFGVVEGRLIRAKTSDGNLVFPDTDAAFFQDKLVHYFDLLLDYQKVLAGFQADAVLEQSLKFAPGIRVLNQAPFETLISFIISANNNVGRIESIVQKLAERFGERFEVDGALYYAFPKPQALSLAEEREVQACGAGYRARYIIGAAKCVQEGFDLKALKSQPYLAARKALTALPGVGDKVADCVLLYALGFKNAFPMDVWVKRVVHEIYGFSSRKDMDVRAFAERKFGQYAGIAQQYLFYYAKANKLR